MEVDITNSDLKPKRGRKKKVVPSIEAVAAPIVVNVIPAALDAAPETVAKPDLVKVKPVGQPLLMLAKSEYETLKARLIAEFPEMDDVENHDVLLDTLHGETNLEDMLVRLVHESRNAELMAKALKDREAVIKQRRERFERKREKLREIVTAEMVRIGRNKIGDVEVDASVRLGKEKLLVTAKGDELPDELVTIETIRNPNKEAIEAALKSKNPDVVEATKDFATILKPEWIITVRTG